ncbi:hypothetical protein C2G38_2225478 [Gigaspora rosea]|uniref:Uncharacterized protein n=1 Tax=Gigaspora rosea TaxID=44941 RepID=A0A397U855_9GLOM|nr:hypothetical protein C2G38_2225478 [Gigaspora rosea]
MTLLIERLFNKISKDIKQEEIMEKRKLFRAVLASTKEEENMMGVNNLFKTRRKMLLEINSRSQLWEDKKEKNVLKETYHNNKNTIAEVEVTRENMLTTFSQSAKIKERSILEEIMRCLNRLKKNKSLKGPNAPEKNLMGKVLKADILGIGTITGSDYDLPFVEILLAKSNSTDAISRMQQTPSSQSLIKQTKEN